MATSSEARHRARRKYADKQKAKNSTIDPRAITLQKRCVTCRQVLPSAEFYVDLEKPRGLRYDCKACVSARRKAWHAKHKETVNHERRLKKFNLTQEQFDALGDCCGVCGVKEGDPGCGRWGKLYVDHDHACCPDTESCGECVRGLLCANCNKGIGNLGDDPERLIAAAAYLIERGR